MLVFFIYLVVFVVGINWFVNSLVDMEDEENSQTKKPVHHRSHDSLLGSEKDDAHGYCTLPRNFRQQVRIEVNLRFLIILTLGSVHVNF